jgi:hypothetical protein
MRLFGNAIQNYYGNLTILGALTGTQPPLSILSSVNTAMPIVGASGVTAAFEFAGNGNVIGTSGLVIGQNAIGASVILARGAQTLAIGVNAGGQLQITANGNVGVAPTTAGGYGLSVAGLAAALFTGGAMVMSAPNTAGQSNGLRIIAGTNSSDAGLVLTNAANTTNYWTFTGDGAVISSGQANEGAGTINCAGLFIGGVAVTAGAGATTGSFTATLTGVSGAGSPVCHWTKVGSTVTMWVPSFSGSSTASSMTISNLPSAIQAATSQATNAIQSYLDPGHITGLGQGNAITSGANFFFALGGNSSGWPGSGSVGVGSVVFTWTTN